VGGDIGGSFGTEQSFFSALVPSIEANTGFDLLADIADDPRFLTGLIENVRAVTNQQLAIRRADPGSLLSDLYTAAIYAGHPASTPANGTPQGVAAITRADVVAAHARSWGAANLVLAVVGDINPEEALAKAERYFGPLGGGMLNVRPAVSPLRRDAPETVRAEAGQEQMQFRIGFHAPGLRDDDLYAMTVLNAIMGGGGGRFFVEIRSELGLAYTATSSYGALTDTGNWFGFAGTEPRSLERALDAARELIRRIRDEPVGDDLVQQRIAQIAGNQILADETNASRAARLSAIEILGDVSTEEFVRRIRRVTPADVQRVARMYLDLDRALTVIVGPPTAA